MATLVALVTGANKGIGRETARQLAQLGHHVYLGSRDHGRGVAAAKELAADGLEVIPVQLDVTDVASVNAAADQLRRDHGRLDCLVNNAGLFIGARTTAMTAEQMRRMFETNVFGVVTVINGLLPLIRDAESPRIVNVSSTTASIALTAAGKNLPGDPEVRAGYTSAKAALNMLTVQYSRTFRTNPELAHIKINSVSPGYTATDMNNFRGTRSVAQAARAILDEALPSTEGASGRFVGDEGPIPW